jgi:tRNA pseudouridine(55) synthase
MKPYVVIEKAVGETPLSCLEEYRRKHIELAGVPMAYAGRLDPMASGKLLILQGEECKVQEKYHNLDKEYVFEVLLGVGSDSGDVLGLIEAKLSPIINDMEIRKMLRELEGEIELPYPHFSSKTVKGKPLHTWKVEGKIDEVAIPTKRSHIYKLTLNSTQTRTADEVYTYATQKIETIPKVTDERKALGNDFRRDDVRASWKAFKENAGEQKYTIASITCICSSGTYMRTLARVIGEKLGSTGLAYSIHRTKIGRYATLPLGLGYWQKKY